MHFFLRSAPKKEFLLPFAQFGKISEKAEKTSPPNDPLIFLCPRMELHGRRNPDSRDPERPGELNQNKKGTRVQCIHICTCTLL